jgi:hypothetical protein
VNDRGAGTRTAGDDDRGGDRAVLDAGVGIECGLEPQPVLQVAHDHFASPPAADEVQPGFVLE